MRGGVRQYVVQEIPQIDTEIGKKDHFWLETSNTRKHGADLFVKRRPFLSRETTETPLGLERSRGVVSGSDEKKKPARKRGAKTWRD